MLGKIRLGKPADNMVALFFLAPFMVVFLTFLVWPILYSFILSFQDQAAGYTLEAPKFVGIANFARLAADKEFWWALAVTLYYSALVIPSGILASLVLAVLLNNRLRGVAAYRSAYFLPNILDTLVVGTIWTLIYAKDGVFQRIVETAHGLVAAPFFAALPSPSGHAWLALGFRTLMLGATLAPLWFLVREYAADFRRHGRHGAADALVTAGGAATFALLFHHGGLNGWIEAILAPAVESGVLGNAYTVMPAIVFALVIKGAGFGMILFLAAIQNISDDVYEAADIDGANVLQQFKYITLPLVKPVIFFMLFTGIAGSLNAFTEIYAISKGGPNINLGGSALGATKLTGYYLFTKWEQSEYGYAAAISYALLLLALLITFIQKRAMRMEEV